MDCAKCTRILALYAGGDLPPKQARELDEHLASCETCKRQLDALRGTLEVLSRATCTEPMLPAEDPSYWNELESKLLGRAIEVEDHSYSRSWWLSVPKVLAQAAVVLVVASLVVWFAASWQRQADEPKRPSVVVFLRAAPEYHQAQVFALPRGDNTILYSDFNHVFSPGEIRRARDQVLPASAEEEGPGPF